MHGDKTLKNIKEKGIKFKKEDAKSIEKNNEMNIKRVT
jgi:hypothetical protein